MPMRFAALLLLVGCTEPLVAEPLVAERLALPPVALPELTAPVVSDPAALSAQALEAHVLALTAPAMRGRSGGSAEETAAAEYVAERLTAFGVEALAGGLVRPVPLRDGGESRNVVGVVRGRGEGWVVVGAHLDHLGVVDGATYHGADDNASGVAVMLEVARASVEASLERSLLFAFFGAEEIGLQGSRHFVREPPIARESIAVMVNIDMVGRRLVDHTGLGVVKKIAGIDDARSIGIIGTAERPWLRAIVKAACADHGLQAWGPEDLPEALGRYVERIAKDRGDNAPFEEVGIPSVFFGNGEHDDYHQPSDTADKLLFPLMELRARAIASAVAVLSGASIPKTPE
jgi:Zn-dependent M28 family amino/carboxypeptidase